MLSDITVDWFLINNWASYQKMTKISTDKERVLKFQKSLADFFK